VCSNRAENIWTSAGSIRGPSEPQKFETSKVGSQRPEAGGLAARAGYVAYDAIGAADSGIIKEGTA
jgi:hypothetical protein